MAAPGDRFELSDNEAVTIRTASAQSGGELLEMEVEWKPSEERPPAHYHPAQLEHFELLEGELTVDMDGQQRTVGAGDAFDVPRGTVHRMWNDGSAPARGTWQVRPALRSEHFFETVDAIRASGRRGKDGALTPLGGAVLLNGFRDEFRLPMPGLVQRPLAAALAGVARLRGYPRPRG